MYQLKMKYFAFLLFSIFLTSTSIFSVQAEEAEEKVKKPSLSAQSAVLLEPESGLVLFDQQADQNLSMASTTKIMTALLALEYAEQHGNPIIELTEEMVTVEGSSMGLLPGYRLSLYDITAGMMMSSGNDAANTLALYIGKTHEGFAKLMNERAQKIGMKNTNFVTASGLDDENHFSTAYDMALLGAEAMKNEDLAKIVASSSYKVSFENPKQTIQYRNHNKLLKMVDGCIGLKTGFTKKSGRCLVSAAERDGVRLIAVTLNAPDDWRDHSALFDYGFSQIETVEFNEENFQSSIAVVGGEADTLPIIGTKTEIALPKEEIALLNKAIHLPRFLYAPIEKGDVVGYIHYYKENKKVANIPIVANDSLSYADS